MQLERSLRRAGAMARLEITTGPGGTSVSVTLSRRNLLALLHKLELPGSARTLINDDCWLNGEQTPLGALELHLHCEEDDEHYGKRPGPPGPMHPATEQFIRRRDGKQERPQ